MRSFLCLIFEKLQETVYQLLELVGENPDREGLLDTPKRVAKMYQEVFSGLGRDPKDEFTAVFSEGHEEVVLVKIFHFIPCVNIISYLSMVLLMSPTYQATAKSLG